VADPYGAATAAILIPQSMPHGGRWRLPSPELTREVSQNPRRGFGHSRRLLPYFGRRGQGGASATPFGFEGLQHAVDFVKRFLLTQGHFEPVAKEILGRIS
jgi:hypothetical protein